MNLRLLLLVLLVVDALAACGDDAPTPPDPPAETERFSGVIAGVDDLQGTFELDIGASARRARPHATTTIAGSFLLGLNPYVPFAVTGVFDLATGTVTLSAMAGDLQCTGQIVEQRLQATCNSLYGVLVVQGLSAALGDIVTSCGTLTGDREGRLNLYTSAAGVAGGVFATTLGETGVMEGTFDGVALALSGSATSATGAASGDTVTGTWMHEALAGGFTAARTCAMPPPAPTLTSFSPASGGIGSTVTVRGRHLAGAIAVTINGTQAAITRNTNTSLRVIVATGTTTGNIAVFTPSGNASTGPFTVTPASATITSFTPSSGQVGATVTITGTGLDTVTGVRFGTSGQTFPTQATATTLFVDVPAGATTGAITLETAAGDVSSQTPFTVTLGPPPVITSFTPTSGALGETVQITGTNLTGATSVSFDGGIAIPFSVSATLVVVQVPTGATTGPITVTTGNGSGTSAATFTVTTGPPPVPTITSITPTSGPPGTLVTITGTDLATTTSVTFNGTSAMLFGTTATTVLATVPTGATSGPVALTTPGGTAAGPTFLVGNFQVLLALTNHSFGALRRANGKLYVSSLEIPKHIYELDLDGANLRLVYTEVAGSTLTTAFGIAGGNLYASIASAPSGTATGRVDQISIASGAASSVVTGLTDPGVVASDGTTLVIGECRNGGTVYASSLTGTVLGSSANFGFPCDVAMTATHAYIATDSGVSRLATPALAGVPTPIFTATDLGGLADVRRVFVDDTTAFVAVSTGAGLGNGRLYQRANDASTAPILLYDSTAARLANPIVASTSDVYFGRYVGGTAYKVMKVPRGVANGTPVEVADAPDLIFDILVDGTHVYWLGSRGVYRAVR